jgi:hypothetical protein
MNEPWFDPARYAWLAGTLVGVFGGVWGSLVGVCASRGRARGLVVGFFRTAVLCFAALAAAGLVALVAGQPWGVWFFLGLPGVLGLLIFLPLRRVMTVAYAQAEARRMQAKDLVA